MRLFPFVGSLILTCPLFAQPKPENIEPEPSYNYAEIDASVISNTKRYESVLVLSKELTAGYQSDHEKIRAIFRWITENISYDCRAFHHPQPLSLDRFYTTHEFYYHRACVILKDRKGVCEDFAVLFYELCIAAGIKCYVVHGITSHSPILVNFFRRMKKFDTNHAWNKVYADGKWYFIDPTWASGTTDRWVRQFTRSFSEQYFLVPVDELYRTHAENKTESADINDFMENPGYPDEDKRFPFIDLFYCPCY